ncbi:hypothetical protein [Amorphus coralli]|uniref:hypothetical protein n=1 Tax=Amorphus coralli TaxID=340680 RepID=UPI000375575A|nr:hypothetical protein [Amorphus coralli]
MSKTRLFVAVLSAAFVALMMAPPKASAQTMGYADAIKILAQSCGADINKYCPKANIGNFGIQKCLQANSSKITPQCKTDYVRVYELIRLRHEAQQAVFQICSRDSAQLCSVHSNVRTQNFAGKVPVLRCLLKAERSVGNKCNQAITDAGYR